MPSPSITFYGVYWCPDCRRNKTFLGDRQIPYTWGNIEEDKAGEVYVLQRHAGKRIIPTIEFADGSLLVEPSHAELAQKLGLRMAVECKFWPLIAIGCRPDGSALCHPGSGGYLAYRKWGRRGTGGPYPQI